MIYISHPVLFLRSYLMRPFAPLLWYSLHAASLNLGNATNACSSFVCVRRLLLVFARPCTLPSVCSVSQWWLSRRGPVRRCACYTAHFVPFLAVVSFPAHCSRAFAPLHRGRRHLEPPLPLAFYSTGTCMDRVVRSCGKLGWNLDPVCDISLHHFRMKGVFFRKLINCILLLRTPGVSDIRYFELNRSVG
ncbi:hypothetical protein J3A83DRAFT_2548286 [Scleroderma citrinum]